MRTGFLDKTLHQAAQNEAGELYDMALKEWQGAPRGVASVREENTIKTTEGVFLRVLVEIGDIKHVDDREVE